MRKSICFLLLFVIAQSAVALNIDISQVVPNEILVCGSAETITVKITNDSDSIIEAVSIKIALPSGINYVDGSLAESTAYNLQEYDVTQDSALVFQANDIQIGDSLKFTINIVALNEAVTFQESGGVFRNTLTITHSSGSSSNLSSSYNILYPALSILTVNPTAETIISGSGLTRTITVINGGNGRTDVIKIVDSRSSAILTLDNVDIGVLSGDTIVLSGADFSGIGNLDDFLDQNESITITESLSGTSCSDITVTSSITALWGCNGSTESTSTSYANVTIDFQSPSLKLIATESLSSCFGAGAASEQQLAITNTGSGIAANINVEIYKSTGGSYNEDIFSRIDESSLQYKIGASGSFSSFSSVTTTSTNSSGNYSCLGVSPVGKVEFSIANLSPSDTIFIVWDMYSCCVQTCVNDAVKGWRSGVTYSDICSSVSYSTNKTGQNENNHYITFTTETPTDIIDGEEEDYTFIVSSFTNSLPQGSGANYKVSFTLDAGLVYEAIKFHSNGIEWTPTSVSYNTGTNVVEAIFPVATPFTVPKSEIMLTLSGNCGTAGWKTIELNMSYIPDNTCSSGCEIPIECNHLVTTYLHCPLPSCDGINVLDFTVERINFGAPDNNLNGLADASGSLDMTQVKANRAMVGDTISATITSVIETATGGWAYAQFTSDVDYGGVLEFLEAELTIYDASAGSSVTINGITASTVTNSYEKEFTYDLSIANLTSLNPALVGYLYSNGDSIQFTMTYRVFNSVIGLLQETTFLNELYVSDVASPSSAEKLNCNFKNGRITLIGYSWRNNSPNNLTVNSCSKSIHQYFGMSIGDESSNYGGGNLFPYEYRHWGTAKEAWVIIPPNYTYVSTTIKQYRTRKTNSTSTQTVYPISPDLISGDTLYYNLDQFYTSGQFTKSDDGFHGRIWVEIAPSCDVPENTYQPVIWTFNYQKSSAIDGAESGIIEASSNDQIKYKRSSLTLSSNNPWQDANTRNISWDYKVKNTSSSGAENAWIHLVPPVNFTIDSILNDSGNVPLIQQSDLYIIGSISANSTADLTIYGTFSNCDTVLMSTYAGYECTGYPTTFSAFECPYEFMPLYVEPKPSAFQTRISADLQADPCSSEIDLIVDITSVKIAHMYDMTIDLITSDTNKIKVKPNTSQFQYNVSNSYVNVAEPSLVSSTYGYVINDFNVNFDLDGIPGVLDFNNNRYRLKVTLELGSQFIPGDFLQIQINGANACNVD
ncbi:MAG: hypothetical protein JKY54_09670 [Flavobacteriales bacterium]|nr:hypothetical protein [Flavobacteriales bacterium]